MGTKASPGAFDCYTKAEDDEPLFVLMARDPCAPILIRLWCEMRELVLNDSTEQLAKSKEARNCASDMEIWALNHPEHGPVKN